MPQRKKDEGPEHEGPEENIQESPTSQEIMTMVGSRQPAYDEDETSSRTDSTPWNQGDKPTWQQQPAEPAGADAAGNAAEESYWTSQDPVQDVTRLYLSEIGQVKLLTQEQEVAYSLQMEARNTLINIKTELRSALGREPKPWEITAQALAQISKLATTAEAVSQQTAVRLRQAQQKQEPSGMPYDPELVDLLTSPMSRQALEELEGALLSEEEILPSGATAADALTNPEISPHLKQEIQRILAQFQHEQDQRPAPPEMDLEPPPKGPVTLLALLDHPVIRQALDRKRDQELQEMIAMATGIDQETVSMNMDTLSTTSLLIPEHTKGMLGKTSVRTLPKKMKQAQTLELIQKTDPLHRQHQAQLDSRGDQAAENMTQANLRLVVSIAKKHAGRGLPFLDLVQEGNIGLMKAVTRFDYRKGFKFSTYATWWIRQAIARSIADQGKTIRIPVHMNEQINKMIRTQRALVQTLGREPTTMELAQEVGVSLSRAEEMLKMSRDPLSLETKVGDEEDAELKDFIQDTSNLTPDQAADHKLLLEQIYDALETLTDREAMVLRMRYGLVDGRQKTLEEVGHKLGVTRERARQIEAVALRKMRHPSRARKLKDYLAN